MFLPITHEIYRLLGKLYIISSPNSLIYTRANYKNKIFSKFGYNMEKERLSQWKEYILPIHTGIPNRFKKEKKETVKKDKIQKENSTSTNSKQYFDNEREDENYLSINPRNIIIDDYLNYHNLNKNKFIQKNEKDNHVVGNEASDDYNNFSSINKDEQDEINISKYLEFKPYCHRSHKRYHCHVPDPSSKSLKKKSSHYHNSNNNDCYHSDCEICQKIKKEDQQKEHYESVSLAMEDLQKEMVDNFCLLLLDAEKVYYSNYNYTPLKILEYTRTYSIQEDEDNKSNDSYRNSFQMTLSNTYTSLDFNNLKNTKLFHSNSSLLDSTILVSSPPPMSSTINEKDEIDTTKSEEWKCSTVNYAYLP
ncbi:hypothetical protein BCR36DRAFT_443810 [Piromyces finnis]|uniref:Uncharacterized protein n=1 Tax=Piromyces finnis TaxID=1754191 RepID=A0A1Y1VCN7_9FUNG|nr:hypothetical protein BCR36DRAFT_443810 [Piromyces finnis]|eukprot:ORX52955.1 hypothetical protein BCR36DRAFT_443810 [Piromyces finnis]